MTRETSSVNSRGMLLSLTLSRIAPQTRNLLTSLLLIEIGATFGTPIGVTNQMNSVTFLLGFIMALLMGILSVNLKHRNLLLIGLVLCVISCIGCYLAPSFLVLVVLYALGGVATNMIFPMSTSLIGQHIPRDDRTSAISYLMAGNALLYLIGMPLVNYIGDWRNSFLYFSIPILLLTLIMVMFYIPKEESTRQRSDVFEGYRGVFSNKSAIASLIGQAFGTGVWIITLSLAISFFREVFSMSRTNVVYLTFGTAFSYLVGTIASSRIIPRLGRKKSVMLSLIVMGVFSLIYLAGLNYLLSIMTCMIVCFFSGVNASASQGLNLEQIPRLQGPMMSLVSAFGGIGYVISLSIGGFLLVMYGWRALGSLTIILSVIGTIVLYFYALEPN